MLCKPAHGWHAHHIAALRLLLCVCFFMFACFRTKFLIAVCFALWLFTLCALRVAECRFVSVFLFYVFCFSGWLPVVIMLNSLAIPHRDHASCCAWRVREKTLTSFITRALAHQPAPIGQTFLVYSSRSRALHVLPREQTLQGTRHQTSNRGMNQQANKNAGRKAHRDTNYTIEWNAILRVAALHTSGAKGSPPDFT